MKLMLVAVTLLAAVTSAVAQREGVRPTVDHHAHISGAAASVLYYEDLPTVTLTPDLDRLLRDYERFQLAGDAAGIASLFTDDGLFPGPGGWVRGREAIRVRGGIGRSNLRLRPTGYSMDGDTAWVTGFFAAGNAPGVPDIARLVLALRRGADGKWLIAARLGEDFMRVDRRPRTAEDLIAQLDAANITRAAVLSVAYWFGDPTLTVADEYLKVRAENDSVAQAVGRHPGRLIGFCSFNPLKRFALDELDRCATNGNIRGVKLHFYNSGVDLLDDRHVATLREVFRAANDRHLAVVVHVWIGPAYGRRHAEIFLNQILPAAPDIPIQIAHMAVTLPDTLSNEGLDVYADAVAAGDARLKHVYFDMAGMVTRTTRPEALELFARRVRQLGPERILFGSDYLSAASESPAASWDAFLRVPLTEEEFRIIAGNVAPYVR
jgi:predicted TIM-barrel fold metal-dependent hydrolase